MEENKKKSELNKLPLLVLALILVGGLAGGYLIYKNKTENTKNSVPTGWIEYKNEELGLKFSYPEDWGNPQLQTNDGFSLGKKYVILFDKEVTPKNNTLEVSSNKSIVLETEDLVKKICETESNCQNIPTITKSYIQQQLNGNKGSFVAYDSSSYAIIDVGVRGIRDSTAHEGTNKITLYKEVSLPKLKVSAVEGVYSKKAKINDCPSKKFGEDIDGCISRTIFTELNKVISSLESI